MWESLGLVNDRLNTELDRLFRDYFPHADDRAEPGLWPALNLWEDGENLYVEAELPGLETGGIDLSVAGDELTLRGERKRDAKEGVACLRRERPWGSFVRSVRLPAAIDADKVRASFSNGVLTVTLPKAAPARTRRIEVKRC